MRINQCFLNVSTRKNPFYWTMDLLNCSRNPKEASASNSWKGAVMYEKMYYKLFNAITEAMDMIEHEKYQAALALLEQATRETEEIYISQ